MWVWMLACVAANDVEQPTDTEEEIDWAERDADWETVLEELAYMVSDDDVPGMAIAVVLDGQLTYADARGVIGYGSDEAVTADHVFKWASVSKMHTAMGVLALEEQGVWDRDDKITDHARFEMADGEDTDPLTLEVLMRHHGALPDELWWSCETTLQQQYRQQYTDEPYYGAPDAYYNYSNSGWNLLGWGIEETTGEDFPDWMQDNVLGPIGMESGTFLAEDIDEDQLTSGFGYWNGTAYEYPLDVYDCPESRPAAWLHGTVYDLAATAEVHLAEGAGEWQAASLDDMRSQSDTLYWSDGNYTVGYGMFAYPYKGVEVVGHDGWVAGYVSEWAIVPEHDMAVVVVANSSQADPYGLLSVTLDAFLDLEDVESSFPGAANDTENWQRYAGTYEDPYVFGTTEVSWSASGGLTVDFLDYDVSSQLVQYSGSAFWFYGWGAWYLMRFVDDPDQTNPEHPRFFVVREGVGEWTDTPEGSLPPPMDPAALQERLAPFGVAEPVFDRRPSERW